MNDLVHAHYLPAILPARALFRKRVEPRLLDEGMSPEVTLLFLIHFSSLGVAMTEPVEGWIRRAGAACKEKGFTRLGRALEVHAEHEANHHLMMIEDTKLLVARYNREYQAALDPGELLARPKPFAVQCYARLHEDVIAGDSPFCQLAIEYEIEGLSVSVGPRLVAHCLSKLGPTVLTGLSFLHEHVTVDVGHTRFNEAELERLLKQDAALAAPLARAGAAALEAYGGFVIECLDRAQLTAGHAPLPAPSLALA